MNNLIFLTFIKVWTQWVLCKLTLHETHCIHTSMTVKKWNVFLKRIREKGVLLQFQTFSALCLLIEDLTPNKEELNDTRRRTGWLNKVHRYRPVIEKVISLHLEDRHIFGEHSQASVNKAKWVIGEGYCCAQVICNQCRSSPRWLVGNITFQQSQLCQKPYTVRRTDKEGYLMIIEAR